MYHVDRSGKLAGIKSFKSALSRVMKWANVYYRRGLAEGTVRCMACGTRVPLQIGSPPFMPPRNDPGVFATCVCDTRRPDARNHSSLCGLANSLPEVQAFWRRNPRIRMAPLYEVEAAGRPAYVFTFESTGAPTHISAIFARDTYDLLSVHGTDEPQPSVVNVHGPTTR
jgi:hypothetical protein